MLVVLALVIGVCGSGNVFDVCYPSHCRDRDYLGTTKSLCPWCRPLEAKKNCPLLVDTDHFFGYTVLSLPANLPTLVS